MNLRIKVCAAANFHLSLSHSSWKVYFSHFLEMDVTSLHLRGLRVDVDKIWSNKSFKIVSTSSRNKLQFNNIKELLLFDTFHDKLGRCPMDLFQVKKCLSFEALVHNQWDLILAMDRDVLHKQQRPSIQRNVICVHTHMRNCVSPFNVVL